jgi:hypothetical protein
MRIVVFLILLMWSGSAWADISWWLVPYDRKNREGSYGRVCAMNRFTATIYGEGGAWSEIETPNNKCLVKVRSSAATITLLTGTANFDRLPEERLTDSLSNLNTPQKNRVRTLILNLGYTAAEFDARFPGDLGQYTFGEVLDFAIQRRIVPRYDTGTDSLVFDGPVIGKQRHLTEVDRNVQ